MSRDCVAGLIKVANDRERYLQCLEEEAQTLCHFDVWPGNIFEGTDEFIMIDWAFAGIGALGEDAANLFYHSAMEFEFEQYHLAHFEEVILESYIDGLASSGTRFSQQTVRRIFNASAIRYLWLFPDLVTNAHHNAYGRNPASESEFIEVRIALLEHILRNLERAAGSSGLLHRSIGNARHGFR
jgi:hypothetical protein